MNKPNIAGIIIGICLAAGYLFMCSFVSDLNFEGSWGGFFCFVFALPFSILPLYAGVRFDLFLILNAIWWWLVGFYLGRCVLRKKIFSSIVLIGYLIIMCCAMFLFLVRGGLSH